MTSLVLKARAKINLSLDVIRKRPDGYHDIKMIMQTIRLHDKVSLEITDSGIEVDCNCRWVPSGIENIAYKAADLFMRKNKIKSGIRIEIEKTIPVAAGLAGGSADAAAVLNGMNRLFSLELKESELMDSGREIGADVPYCIKGGTMLAEGTGDILTVLSPLPRTSIVLVKPEFGVSTAWVYKSLNLEKIKDKPDTGMLIEAIRNKRIDILAGNMKNVLESVTAQKYGEIGCIKDRLIKMGAIGSMMSGSGPTVFGIFTERRTARHAYEALKNDRWDCFLTETI